ncbi:MAG: DUF1566 domain-containing protein [Leptospiraceae bacterium]|nr:DUF1566 domain-containing protein [Leptospiraceae bacterium]
MKKNLALIIFNFLILSGCSLFQSDDNDDENNRNLAIAAYYLSQQSSTGCTYSVTSTSTTTSTGKFTVVDTAQSTCYNSTSGATTTCSAGGTGSQDGYYSGANATTNTKTPSYTKSSDSTTVTDNNTGITWTQSPDTNGDGSINVSDKMTQLAAYNYCASLTKGGFSDWRLPSVKELYSLMNFGQGRDPSSCSNCTSSTLSGKTFLNDSVFAVGFGDTSASERLIDGQYATTSVYGGKIFDKDWGVFGVNFVDGRIKGYECSATKTYFVLCARGNTDYGLNNFTDNGNGTITDSATGLMWQKADSAVAKSFDEGLTYCENLSLGGQTDWRLPNIKELNSIVDYSRAPDYATNSGPAINSIFTVSTITNEENISDYPWYWSSTTHIACSTSSNDCSTGDSGSAGAYQTFGRALGYYTNAVQDVHGAGAQRSNNKTIALANSTAGASSTSAGNGTFYYWGPQGDVLRGANYVRCVRN